MIQTIVADPTGEVYLSGWRIGKKTLLVNTV